MLPLQATGAASEAGASGTDWVGVAVAGGLIAGALHVVVAPEHGQHAPAHGLFIMGLGVVQLGWAAMFPRRPTGRLWAFGVLLAGASITLWFITRVWPAPFTGEPEEVDAPGVLVKLAEGATVGALFFAARGPLGAALRAPAGARSPALLLAAAAVLGAMSYGAGIAVEPFLPSLGETGQHHVAEPGGALTLSVERDEESATLIVQPKAPTTGPVSLDLFLYARGVSDDKVAGVNLTFTSPHDRENTTLAMQPGGHPGHFHAEGRVFPVEGTWTITATVDRTWADPVDVVFRLDVQSEDPDAG